MRLIRKNSRAIWVIVFFVVSFCLVAPATTYAKKPPPKQPPASTPAATTATTTTSKPAPAVPAPAIPVEGKAEVIANGLEEAAKDIQAAFELSQKELKELYGAPLTGNQKIILAADKAAFTVLLAKEFGLTKQDAENAAKINSWRFGKGTTIIEVGSLPSKLSRTFVTANLIMRQFQVQQAPYKLIDRVVWLRNGSADAFAAVVTEQAGIVPANTYTSSWQSTVGAVSAWPSLLEMESEQGWNNVSKKYGSTLPVPFAAIAVIQLTDSKGSSSINTWLIAAKKLNDPAEAFAKTFGLSLEEYAIEYTKKLKSLPSSL